MKKKCKTSVDTDSAPKRGRRTRSETEEELRTALRVLKEAGDPITVSAVATAVGVTPGLVHNKYPAVAEAIRTAAGRAAGTRLTELQQQLQEAQARNASLRQENTELLQEVRQLASVNEALRQQLVLSNAIGTGKVTRLPLS